VFGGGGGIRELVFVCRVETLPSPFARSLLESAL
jgi:hypothetical protein